MRMRKPRGFSERCGVSVSSNSGFVRFAGHAGSLWRFAQACHIDSAWGKTKRAGRGAAKLRERTAAIFERLAAQAPAPQTELDYVNPYTLLVAVVLSAQATDAGVNKATKPLFAIADTAAKMVALGEAAVHGADQDHRPVPQQGEERRSRFRRRWSKATAARSRATARRWRRCRASAARRPTWC